MTDLESLLRQAVAARVTVIHLDTSHSTARAGCWKAFDKYYTAWHADPIEALRDALGQAMTPKPTSDLSDLLN